MLRDLELIDDGQSGIIDSISPSWSDKHKNNKSELLETFLGNKVNFPDKISKKSCFVIPNSFEPVWSVDVNLQRTSV